MQFHSVQLRWVIWFLSVSNWQLDELKSVIEDGTEAVLRLSSNMIGELLSTIRKVSNLHKVFADKSSTDITLSKTQTYRSYNLDDFLLDFLVHY